MTDGMAWKPTAASWRNPASLILTPYALERLPVCLLIHEPPRIGFPLHPTIILRIVGLRSITDRTLSASVTRRWIRCHAHHPLPRKIDRHSDRSASDSAAPIRPIVALVPIVFPLQRLQVAEVIGAALRNGLDVIDLPTELLGLAVLDALHARATRVFPEARVLGFRSSLPPNRLDRRFVERSPARCATRLPGHCSAPFPHRRDTPSSGQST